MIDPRQDGITHINVYTKGVTELGRLLTNLAHTPFVVDDHQWQSVEGWWYWQAFRGTDYEVYAKNELSKLYGFKAKSMGKQLQEYYQVCSNIHPDFKSEIIRGIRAKLRQNKHILRLLARSELPLIHYYYYGDPASNPKVINKSEHQWQLDDIMYCRSLLQNQLKGK